MNPYPGKKSLFCLLFLSCILSSPGPCPGYEGDEKYPVLKKYIIEYNTKHLKFSLSEGTYRGEEGILMIRPDVARDFNLKADISRQYLESQKYYDEAEDTLNKAENALEYNGKKKSDRILIKNMVENIISYKEKTLLARERIEQYKAGLDRENDDRFNDDLCNEIIVRQLDDCFLKTENSLRDGLGLFFNRSRGIKKGKYHITTENVKFINFVFKGFLNDAPASARKKYNLDKHERNGSEVTGSWEKIARKDLPKLARFIEKAAGRVGEKIYRVDPLLFMSLMRKESDFKPLAVSGVGAAGLTQIMPQTAIDLGLKNIYIPEYYHKASGLLKKERSVKKQAEEEMMGISSMEDTSRAENARNLMLKLFEIKRERKALYNRYKKELVKNGKDERLDPEKAIESGLVYFAKLMKAQKGDISLALASYNAGPHRVKQYNGIPPYEETVGFRNRILKFYSAYLARLDEE